MPVVTVRTDLFDDIKVVRMANSLKTQHPCPDNRVLRNAIVGALPQVWGVMADEGERQGKDLVVLGVKIGLIDDIAGLPGLADAMKQEGWVREIVGGLCFPSYFKRNKAPKKSQKRPEFVIPTVDEVTAYCIERKNKVDPERFIAHYTTRDWMAGRVKMKDWKAAVITWEKNGFDDRPAKAKADPDEWKSAYRRVKDVALTVSRYDPVEKHQAALDSLPEKERRVVMACKGLSQIRDGGDKKMWEFRDRWNSTETLDRSAVQSIAAKLTLREDV